MKNDISLYIHIPFCKRKCLYCDFLSFAADDRVKDEYLDALDREAEAMLPLFDGKRLVSVFIGGGTPTSLNEKQLKRLADTVLKVKGNAYTEKNNFEYTVECNPGTVNAEKMKILRDGGANRISFGLQTTDKKELEALGRIHSHADFLDSVSYAREAGFTNISADLISSIPFQTEKSFEKTLTDVAGLGLTHISAYSLIVEEGTPFFEMYSPGVYPLPDEETERNIYYRTGEILAENGYERYEISNYAKPGYESVHNCGYWTGREYLGLGLGASSYLKTETAEKAGLSESAGFAETACPAETDGLGKTEGPAETCGKTEAVRTKNTAVIESYIKNPVCNYEEKELLSRNDLMAEFMILGLRMKAGISESEFAERFSEKPESVYGKILEKHIKRGLMEHSDGRYFLTARGTDISNSVMCDFLP